jgi:metal-sulfur cluster biosynthetic enzyme
MKDPQILHQAILERLSQVIDPEAGVDVVRMRLVEDLIVDDRGQVSYTFHPSSPLCPIAIPLSNMIQLAVAEVPGVTSQDVKVIGFALSDELTVWLKQALEAGQSKQEKK